jgi:hypothetical protein
MRHNEDVRSEAVSASTLELLEWIQDGRTYAATMEAWGSWCPRHAAWEDAVAGGLVRVVRVAGGARVVLTERGRDAMG